METEEFHDNDILYDIRYWELDEENQQVQKNGTVIVRDTTDLTNLSQELDHNLRHVVEFELTDNSLIGSNQIISVDWDSKRKIPDVT